MWAASLLAWPDGSGVAGGFILGAAGYVHSHVLARRRHRERLGQARLQHLERRADAAAHHNERLHQAERHHTRLLEAVAATATQAVVIPPPPPGEPLTFTRDIAPPRAAKRKGGTL